MRELFNYANFFHLQGQPISRPRNFSINVENEESFTSVLNSEENNQAQNNNSDNSDNDRPTSNNENGEETKKRIKKIPKIKKKRSKKKEKTKKIMKKQEVKEKENDSLEDKNSLEGVIIYECHKNCTYSSEIEINNQPLQLDEEENHENLVEVLNNFSNGENDDENDDGINPDVLSGLQGNFESINDSNLNDNEILNSTHSEIAQAENSPPENNPQTSHNHLINDVTTFPETHKSLNNSPPFKDYYFD